MKLCIFTDNHFCENSSIIRKFGTKYSVRIENQLKSLDWLEQVAIEEHCDYIICAGDFFDKPNLTDMEITALRDINWAALPHYFLVGNHESSLNGLRHNSTKALENHTASGQNKYVISTPTSINFGDTEVCFLPYIIESDRKPVLDYFGPKTGKRIILSHNDIKGIQMGPVVSKTGFEIPDLEANADLIINGHLHNGQPVSQKVINLGNLTGQNFGEDAERYNHNIMILDTDTMTFDLIENPYAFNFYKLEVNTEADFNVLNRLKEQAVVSIKCKDTLVPTLKEILATKRDNIVESRIIISKEACSTAEADITELTVNHVAKFVECARAKFGADEILEMELAEVCK